MAPALVVESVLVAVVVSAVASVWRLSYLRHQQPPLYPLVKSVEEVATVHSHSPLTATSQKKYMISTPTGDVAIDQDLCSIMLKPASATRGGKGKTRRCQLDPGNQCITGKVFLDAIRAEAERKEREKARLAEEKKKKAKERKKKMEEKKEKNLKKKKKKRDAKGKAKGPTSAKKEDRRATKQEGFLRLQDLLQIVRRGRNCQVGGV